MFGYGYRDGPCGDYLRNSPRDIDIDRTVTFGDFVTLSSHFSLDVQSWSEDDFDGDGKAGFSDFVLLTNNFDFAVLRACVGLLALAPLAVDWKVNV